MIFIGGENFPVITLSCDFIAVGLTLTVLGVLVTTIDAQWEGMGDVGSAR